VVGLFCNRRLRGGRQTGRRRRGVRTTRLRRPRQRHSSKAPTASTASRPAFVTIASRPSLGRDGAVIILIWVRSEAECFLKWDWTAQITLIRFNKFGHARSWLTPG